MNLIFCHHTLILTLMCAAHSRKRDRGTISPLCCINFPFHNCVTQFSFGIRSGRQAGETRRCALWLRCQGQNAVLQSLTGTGQWAFCPAAPVWWLFGNLQRPCSCSHTDLTCRVWMCCRRSDEACQSKEFLRTLSRSLYQYRITEPGRQTQTVAPVSDRRDVIDVDERNPVSPRPTRRLRCWSNSLSLSSGDCKV